jgi:ribosomal protein S18 acetylase RimI-like enzyme
MANEPIVRRATPSDVPELAAMLARAFVADPFFAYLAGDAPERGQRMRDGWQAILRHASAGLAATWTTDDLAGAALWIPPGRSASGALDQLRMLPALGRLTGWGRLRAVSAALETLERRRRSHAPMPHWYLSALGVEPARQGEGIGSALLAPVLQDADASAVPCYLETAVGRNVLLYERHGFDVVEELVLPNTDVHGWLMLRPASAATGSAGPRTRPNRTGSG